MDMDLERLYQQLAEKNGVSVDDIKREIEETLAQAYQNPNSAAQQVPRKDAVPTLEELLLYFRQQIKS